MVLLGRACPEWVLLAVLGVQMDAYHCLVSDAMSDVPSYSSRGRLRPRRAESRIPSCLL
jgi:hypothetical protein